jgi:prophage tail gpP-like protein
MPNPQEVASIVVGGRRFDDWESVWVQHRWTEQYPLFRFTAAERDPVPELWQTLQFKPQDECAIYLGGMLAINGVILTRQVAYDANSHGVMLQGVGIQWYVGRASVLDEKGNFDEMTFEQIARKVIAPFGVGIHVIGSLNATPFKRLQVNPGETVWDFLERLARVRGIILGSDHLGNFLLIGDHAGSLIGSLIEGVNILKCQCVIAVENMFSEYWVRAQTAASDDQHGRQASEQECKVPGTAKRYSPLLTPAEQPVWNLAEVCDRASNEALWHEGTIIQATITVQGWFNPAGGLWAAGADVIVRSPMAMLDMVLKVQTATFTQDRNSGTLTMLDLVAPWLLKDRSDFNVGRVGAPQAPTGTRPPGEDAPREGAPFATPPVQLED